MSVVVVDAGATIESQNTDAGFFLADAGHQDSLPGVVDSGSLNEDGAPVLDEEGCGCHAAFHGKSMPRFCVVLLLGLYVLRRKRLVS